MTTPPQNPFKSLKLRVVQSLEAPAPNVVSFDVIDEYGDKVGEILNYHFLEEGTIYFRVLSNTAAAFGTVTEWRTGMPPRFSVTDCTGLDGTAACEAAATLIT